jgi:hypothetical protein
VHHPEQGLDGRGLPCSVGPEEADDLPGTHVEVDLVQYLAVPIGLAKSGGCDGNGTVPTDG